MAKVFDHITDELQAFINRQAMFFVATAPLSETGHINVSPKGLDCLRILSPNQVAYCDLTGSGNETSAHLQENRRITFMFCAFEKAPLILRLYGQGKTVLPTMPEWEPLASCLPAIPGTRQIITATIDRVQTSCGMGVPLFTLDGQRDDLLRWADKKGEQGLLDYWKQKNVTSIDQITTPLGAAISQGDT